MNLTVIMNVVGTLFPIIFPKQEFKPRRAVAVLVAFVVAIVAVHYLGVEGTEQAIESAGMLLELAEE